MLDFLCLLVVASARVANRVITAKKYKIKLCPTEKFLFFSAHRLFAGRKQQTHDSISQIVVAIHTV